MNGFKVILKSPMMAVVMTITSLLFIRFLLKYNSSRNIVLCEWNKHTFSCYFPLSIRTRLVLSFEFDNICSVNIHISYDNKEHEHIWRLQQQQKKHKKQTLLSCYLKYMYLILSNFVTAQIFFCLEIGISRFYFFDYQLIFFFAFQEKNLSRELCGGTQWLFQKHAVPPLWQFITKVFLIDCFSLFWYREKTVILYDIHQIGHRQLI